MIRAPPPPVRLDLANAEKRSEKKEEKNGAGTPRARLAPHTSTDRRLLLASRRRRGETLGVARGAARPLRSVLGKLPAAAAAAVATARSDRRQTRRRIRRATRA
jgi:hypothetical protein